MTLSRNHVTSSDSRAVFRTTAKTNGVARGEDNASGEILVGKLDPPRGTLCDPITGLSNEHHLLASLQMATRETGADGVDAGQPTVVVLQIDRISHVASCFGPAAQKSMLEVVARRLDSITPPDGTLARTGDNEFTYLIESGHARARLLAALVEAKLRQPVTIDGRPVLPAARIGISSWSGDGQDPRDVLSNARLAAVGPDRPGFASATVYDARLRERTVEQMRLEAELSLALERDELRLDYQPIISIVDGAVTGFEALLRWDHPVHGIIMPDDIIPLAEETGLIEPIGDWVLNRACTQMAEWQGRYDGARNLTLNVNLSARQLEKPDLVSRVIEAQRSSGIAPGTLRLELTETMIVANEEAVERLRELRQHGIEIHLDDFGSGYSSLGYLGRLPIDSLKLDRSFVEQCETDGRSATILDAVVALARELGLAVTAEGIETSGQAERIRSLACETGQGYFFHRPLGGEAVEQLLLVA